MGAVQSCMVKIAPIGGLHHLLYYSMTDPSRNPEFGKQYLLVSRYTMAEVREMTRNRLRAV